MTLQHETCRTQAGVTARFSPREYLSEEESGKKVSWEEEGGPFSPPWNHF